MYDQRARNVFAEIASSAAEAMHAEVLEVFDTEGYGKWPPFAWQRRGEPPPGTPMGPRLGPVTPKQAAAREKEAARVARKKAAARVEARRQKKLRARFGFAMGAVDRAYAGGVKPSARPSRRKKKRRRSAKTARYYRRMQGSPKLLQDTGNLVGSVTPFSANDVIEVFTNVPYAKYHVSPEPRRVIPLRDFFDIDLANFEADVVRMVLFRIERGGGIQAAE